MLLLYSISVFSVIQIQHQDGLVLGWLFCNIISEYSLTVVFIDFKVKSVRWISLQNTDFNKTKLTIQFLKCYIYISLNIVTTTLHKASY